MNTFPIYPLQSKQSQHPDKSQRLPSAKANVTTKTKQTHTVRIIGGVWRRHRLLVLDHDGLRPSSDRVRETVFNWVQHLWFGQFADKFIVDAFAGTGAFGLEAISRGADQVWLIDLFKPACHHIQKTLEQWRTQTINIDGQAVFASERFGGIRVQQGRCMDFLTRLAAAVKVTEDQTKTSPTKIDWLVLDPPFHQGLLAPVLEILPDVLNDQALVYIEHEHGLQLNVDPRLVVLREGKTGQSIYQLLRYCAIA